MRECARAVLRCSSQAANDKSAAKTELEQVALTASILCCGVSQRMRCLLLFCCASSVLLSLVSRFLVR